MDQHEASSLLHHQMTSLMNPSSNQERVTCTTSRFQCSVLRSNATKCCATPASLHWAIRTIDVMYLYQQEASSNSIGHENNPQTWASAMNDRRGQNPDNRAPQEITLSPNVLGISQDNSRWPRRNKRNECHCSTRRSQYCKCVAIYLICLVVCNNDRVFVLYHCFQTYLNYFNTVTHTGGSKIFIDGGRCQPHKWRCQPMIWRKNYPKICMKMK